MNPKGRTNAGRYGQTVSAVNVKFPQRKGLAVGPFRVGPEIFSANWSWTGRYFLCFRYYSILGLTNPNSLLHSAVCSDTIYGVLCSSPSFSVPLLLPAEIRQQENLSFLAMQAKELSIHSLALPKDVCPWWVFIYIIQTHVYIYFNGCLSVCIWLCSVYKSWILYLIAGFGEASPEAKAAKNLHNFFTYIAVRIVTAQLQVPLLTPSPPCFYILCLAFTSQYSVNDACLVAWLSWICMFSFQWLEALRRRL